MLAGVDGRIADVTVLKNAIATGFNVPEARFYLADTGFGLAMGKLP